MTELPHHKARALLQLAADRDLLPADRSALEAHLKACQECVAYADSLTSLEASLRKAFYGKWDHERPHLNLRAIEHPSQSKLLWINIFGQTHALGKVAVMAALALGYIVMINLIGVRVPIVNNETPTALPTPNGYTSTSATSPTLPAQQTITNPAAQACKTIIYVVQENDSLESIAVRHGITKEALLEYNKDADMLASNMVFTGMELVIPLCETTPSRTASLPGSLLTITPKNGTILPEQPQ